MAKEPPAKPILLRWSEHVPTVDVQDPLGTSLRGAARLTSSLLFCITSITPRARYFSFIPWCVYDYEQREKGKPYAKQLKEAVALRENALTLGCVASHDGEACRGGGLVGSREAIKWYKSHPVTEPNLTQLKFVKNPALFQYLTSLANLGAFVTDEELPDEESEDTPRTLDSIELDDLGRELALRYEACVGTLNSIKEVSAAHRQCSMSSLKAWGQRGGLCELKESSSADRDLLRDIFFCRIPLKGESHPFRRRSLLLLLETSRILAEVNRVFSHGAFADAVYYGELAWEGETDLVRFPDPLLDIATRWRMFYFHYYMAVALEGMFAWLVLNLGGRGLAGETITEVVSCLQNPDWTKQFENLFNLTLQGDFGSSTPSQFFSSLGIPGGRLTDVASTSLDNIVRPDAAIAETNLEKLLRSGEHQQHPTGLALSLVLLVMTLARFRKWEDTKYESFLANKKLVRDPNLDLTPPVVARGLTRHLGDWWNRPWSELAVFVLSRYVVQQHQRMSDEKSATSERCLLQSHGSRVCATGSYEKIGTNNARFRSAVQVLVDLGLLERPEEEEAVTLTKDGRDLLESELAKEVTS
jgi:hypothetical protein